MVAESGGMMSTDQIAFIMENCHACDVTKHRLYVVISFQLHEDDSWQQIEVDHSIWENIFKRYAEIVGKWHKHDSD